MFKNFRRGSVANFMDKSKMGPISEHEFDKKCAETAAGVMTEKDIRRSATCRAPSQEDRPPTLQLQHVPCVKHATMLTMATAATMQR